MNLYIFIIDNNAYSETNLMSDLIAWDSTFLQLFVIR